MIYEGGVFVRSLLERSEEEEAKHHGTVKPISINKFMKKRCVYCRLIEAQNFLTLYVTLVQISVIKILIRNFAICLKV